MQMDTKGGCIFPNGVKGYYHFYLDHKFGGSEARETERDRKREYERKKER